MYYIIRSSYEQSLIKFVKWLRDTKNIKVSQKLPYQIIFHLNQADDDIIRELRWSSFDVSVVEEKQQPLTVDGDVIKELLQITNDESKRLDDLADVLEDNDYMKAKHLRYQAHQLDAVVALLSFSFSEYL